eukprot:jgi/Botrbrau1/7527/Bobra.0019s0015.1
MGHTVTTYTHLHMQRQRQRHLPTIECGTVKFSVKSIVKNEGIVEDLQLFSTRCVVCMWGHYSVTLLVHGVFRSSGDALGITYMFVGKPLHYTCVHTTCCLFAKHLILQHDRLRLMYVPPENPDLKEIRGVNVEE